MVVGLIIADLLLGDVHSLKQKRGVVRPIVADIATEDSFRDVRGSSLAQ